MNKNRIRGRGRRASEPRIAKPISSKRTGGRSAVVRGRRSNLTWRSATGQAIVKGGEAIHPDRVAEGSKGRRACLAAGCSGGLKSLWRSNEGRYIRKRGVMPRWPEVRLWASGGQGVHQVDQHKVESEGHEEKYRAVIDGGYPEDEPVGRRWGKVESALW